MSMIVNPFGSFASGVADPSFANVSFLCHCNGTNGSTTVTDSSGVVNTINVVGDAQVTTTAPLFGTGCLQVTSTGYIWATHATAFAFGTGDFTYEFAFKTAAPTQGKAIADTSSSGADVTFQIEDKGTGAFGYWSWAHSVDEIAGGTVATSTWQRFAICRVSGNTRMFIDGTQVGSTYVDTDSYASNTLWYGGSYNHASQCSGFFDEIRVTKGVGRYASNYTVAAAAFPDS